ncbi:MAG: glycerol kinase GlpK [Oscillospiraceae bacterium]|nr:glycerol kinase GlpK [Oscillospiraceae bacterium]
MASPQYILSLDQGTTSSRAIIFDMEQNIVSVGQKEFEQIFPQPGWVEHNPMEIYNSQLDSIYSALEEQHIPPSAISCIGITNQRETTIMWDKSTGEPIYNAIVWQCRRSAPLCEELIASGMGETIRKKTGLLPDAYFSSTKIRWILDNVPDARRRAEAGEILFGTVDTWLIWKLTGGKVHATDYTNASRTMLFNIHTLEWDKDLLKLLNIPECILPEVKNSSDNYGTAVINGVEIPITGVAGDQQAALFGQCCFEKGEAKNTYGTGCFLLMNTGDEPIQSKNNLITTIAAGINGKVTYALEGSVFVGGAVIQWLRDQMKFITHARESETMAQKVADNGGVYLVPAFTGLGAPYWDMYARGCLIGITRGTTPEHIVRAAEESIAYQTADLLDAMVKDTGIPLKSLKADGGASADNFLMQFQADVTGVPIQRPAIRETTALGAAYLAGLYTGIWKDTNEISSSWKLKKQYLPQMDHKDRSHLLEQWHKAVRSSMGWAR